MNKLCEISGMGKTGSNYQNDNFLHSAGRKQTTVKL